MYSKRELYRNDSCEDTNVKISEVKSSGQLKTQMDYDQFYVSWYLRVEIYISYHTNEKQGLLD